MLLEKLPAPEPSIVLLSAIMGVLFVLQHTPLEIIVPEPSSVIVPPLITEVANKLVTSVVVKVGTLSFLQE
jgi:hypothetical protein